MKTVTLKIAGMVTCVMMTLACGTEQANVTGHASLQSALESAETPDDCLALCSEKGESEEDCAIWCDESLWDDKKDEHSWEDKGEFIEDTAACYDECIEKGESEEVCDAYCNGDKGYDWGDKEEWTDGAGEDDK